MSISLALRAVRAAKTQVSESMPRRDSPTWRAWLHEVEQLRKIEASLIERWNQEREQARA